MIWKQINDDRISSGYSVSSDGLIKDSDGIIKEPYRSTNGYVYGCFKPSKSVNMSDKFGHRLVVVEIGYIVACAFIKIQHSPGKKFIVYHIDGDNSNNSVVNLQWKEDVEIWTEIQYDTIESTGYFISNWGRVKTPSGLITCGTNQNGYKRLTLRLVGHKRHQFMIHTFVANMFVNNYSAYRTCVNHIDGDPSNNHYLNLEFVTYGENLRHAIKIGLTSRFSTAENVDLVRKLLIKYDGSTIAVVNDMRQQGFDDIQEYHVNRVKKLMISEGIRFRINLRRKMIGKVYSDVCMLLREKNGHVIDVYNALHSEYPYLTYDNISSVKEKLKREGVKFISAKHNRKITEEKREKILDLLLIDRSVSNVFKKISSDPYFADVTVYDVKYLKRKYIKGI